MDLTRYVEVTLSPPVLTNLVPCPAFVPGEIERIFNEGARCISFGAFDAAGVMFRKSLDAATRALLPEKPEAVQKDHVNYISFKVAKDLRLRLNWLFERKLLPLDLQELASCVHQDGNDAAHSVETIGDEGALDLQDFTIEILEFLYTRPGQIADNIDRRSKRRGLS